MIPFPDISPNLFEIELFGLTLALRWYALAYIVGLLFGWWIVRRAVISALTSGNSSAQWKRQATAS